MPNPKGNPNIAQIGATLGGKPKGSKNWKTIAKENARNKYEDKLAKEFDEITDVQFQEAKKKENRQERQYVTDQYIGRATETRKIELEIDMDLEL